VYDLGSAFADAFPDKPFWHHIQRTAKDMRRTESAQATIISFDLAKATIAFSPTQPSLNLPEFKVKSLLLLSLIFNSLDRRSDSTIHQVESWK
jgi:hypothetical protein